MKIQGTYQRLDINGDGVVDISDLTLAIQVVNDIIKVMEEGAAQLPAEVPVEVTIVEK